MAARQQLGPDQRNITERHGRSFSISVRLTLTDGSLAWQNNTLDVGWQLYTADDGMAMVLGMLAFMMIISAVVGVVAMTRRHQ